MARTQFLFVIFSLLLCASFTSVANEEPRKENVQWMEEVTVTAQKREQNLQDVGISVTAFTGDQIRELGFTSAIDLVAQTPALEVTGPGAGTINTFSIRGVTQNDFASVHESPVAVYVDQAYISQSVVTNFSLFDLERVEVLRGPQGTLFGRNATGGLVHYITAKPSQEASGFGEIQLGEQGRRRFEAAVGGGFSDTVFGRIAAVYNKSDGLIENDIGPDGKTRDDYSVRAQLLIEPSDDLSILLKGQYAKEDSIRGVYSHTVGFDGEFSTDPAATDWFGYRDADGSPYTGSFDFAGFKKSKIRELTATIDWDIGEVTLTSVSNYQDIDHSYAEDADVSPNYVFNFISDDDAEQFSQELRLYWEGDRSRNVVGVYYLDISGDYVNIQDLGPAFGGPFDIVTTGVQDTETIALFGQMEYDLTDTLVLTVGGRWNRDKKNYVYGQAIPLFFGPDAYLVYEGDFSDDDWSAKVQLDYKPNDNWLWYVGVNRGIKSGGFNMPIDPSGITDPETQFQYDGEVLTSYEGGFKASITENTRLNIGVFYYDYKDYQAFTFEGLSQLVFNANAKSKGGEIELVSTPVNGLYMMLGASLLDTKVKDIPESVVPDGEEDAPLSPKLSFNGLVRYSWLALGGSVAVQADFNWRDKQNFNLLVTPVVQEGSYGVLNASIWYTNADGDWYGSIFVNNLLDEEYRTYAFDTTAWFGSVEDVIGIERWFGLSVGYRW